ncbi:MAG: hypothetical protein JXQ73_28945 [Phycisphaerae bacterium]|nr:hypothetical protein [Phycisphaerae bacterium]
MSSRHHRKPKLHFTIRLKGLFPEQVPFRAVADAVAAVQRMVRMPDEDSEISIRVVDIKRTSAAYRCISTEPDMVIDRLRQLGRFISGDEHDPAFGWALPQIRKLSMIADQNDCQIELRQAGESTDGVLARIGPSTYEQICVEHTISGMTVLFGQLLRVGGADRPKCMVRPHNQKHVVYCSVTHKLAKQLAPQLYNRVALEGQAVWLRNTWDVLTFSVARVAPYKKRDLSEAREALRRAGADRWDDVSPSRLVSELDS